MKLRSKKKKEQSNDMKIISRLLLIGIVVWMLLGCFIFYKY
jgi:hypothetical protein